MRDSFPFFDFEAFLWQSTSQSAMYQLLAAETNLGKEVIGSLDIHLDCQDEDGNSATIVTSSSHQLHAEPDEIAQQLSQIFDLPEKPIWDVRIWIAQSGIYWNNDPRTLNQLPEQTGLRPACSSQTR